MNIVIEFSTGNDAFVRDFWGEYWAVLTQAGSKIAQQQTREPCLCTHPEAADVLLDTNGNTVGRVAWRADGDALPPVLADILELIDARIREGERHLEAVKAQPASEAQLRAVDVDIGIVAGSRVLGQELRERIKKYQERRE